MNQKGINSKPVNSHSEYSTFGWLNRRSISKGRMTGATGSLMFSSPCGALPFSRRSMFAEAAVLIAKHQMPSFIFLCKIFKLFPSNVGHDNITAVNVKRRDTLSALAQELHSPIQQQQKQVG